ncbi:MAG: TAXI family TRAP transporter solute-binding subunit [Clostridiales bacterium]|nr:TAXI family TRAP transporter solute-binding subunit [Clostridiales bacterium]
MKKPFYPILFLLIAVIVTASGCGTMSDRQELRFGTGGIGGNYYAYGSALSHFLEEDIGGNLQINTKSTAGSAANLRLISEDYLQLAIVQSDTLLDAVNGTGVFTDDSRTGFQALAGLYTESCQIVVSCEAQIECVSDLVGKRISIGEEDSGVCQNAEQILLSNGISLNMLDVQYMSFADSAQAMKNGDLDGFFCTAGAPTTAVSELASSMEIRLLSLDERTIHQLTSLYPCYTNVTIPAGTYPNQTEEIATVGVKAVLIANESLSADLAQAITASVFEHASELQYATGSKLIGDYDYAVTSIPIEFHPGAVQYYENQGITLPSGDSAQ